MRTKNKDFVHKSQSEFQNLENLKIGIVVSEWNIDITSNLHKGAVEKLNELGLKNERITSFWVPGAFELVYACKELFKKKFDAIIAIGCVIKGETDHYDFICNSVSNGLMELNASGSTPVIFCVLTDHNIDQSIARSGGKKGNKGSEAAIAAIKMATFNNAI
tara:strand:+ start:833 stop:1318 length:486 start_codon:yes stop_codon:yes gene_type:complete